MHVQEAIQHAFRRGWFMLVQNRANIPSVRFRIDHPDYAHEWVWFARARRWGSGPVGSVGTWEDIEEASCYADVDPVLDDAEAEFVTLWALVQEHCATVDADGTRALEQQMMRSVNEAQWRQACAPSRDAARATVLLLSLAAGERYFVPAARSDARDVMRSLGLEPVRLNDWANDRVGWEVATSAQARSVSQSLAAAGYAVVCTDHAWWCRECALPSASSACCGCGASLGRPFPALRAA